MADNLIQRVIRLVFDRNSGKEVEGEAKKTLGKVDGAIKEVEGTISRLAKALIAAFAIKKVIDFGVASVQAAIESEKAWSALEQAINNTGESFGKWESRIRAGADAFAAATIHDDDSYAQSLQRLVVLTGDVTASTNNMGLVANVAAAFFEGDLGPATDLVAKAMNGNVTQLQKMGIQAKSAQDALDILAQRSMGAATKEAGTFGGQLAQVNNLWGEFKEEVGFAIIGSDGATNALGLLKGVLIAGAEWIGKNRDAIREWVVKAVNFAITAVDVLYRAVFGLGNLFQGAFNVALGEAALGIAKLARGYAAVVDAANAVAFLIGKQMVADWAVHSAAVRADAQALEDWAESAKKGGKDQFGKGIDLFVTPRFEGIKAPNVGPGNLPKVSPMITAPEHDLDKLAKLDADYWRKRIRQQSDAAFKMKAIEKDVSAVLYKEFSARQEAAATVASALFQAIGSGLGPTAALKAKQNLLEAGELAARAVIASLNPFTAWQVGPLTAGALKHAGFAAGWFALSQAAGGGGGGSTNQGGGTGGVSGFTAAGTSASRAAEAEAPGVQVIVMVDGIDPLNQSHLVRLKSANQQIKELYGDNYTLTVMPRSG